MFSLNFILHRNLIPGGLKPVTIIINYNYNYYLSMTLMTYQNLQMWAWDTIFFGRLAIKFPFPVFDFKSFSKGWGFLILKKQVNQIGQF